MNLKRLLLLIPFPMPGFSAGLQSHSAKQPEQGWQWQEQGRGVCADTEERQVLGGERPLALLLKA